MGILPQATAGRLVKPPGMRLGLRETCSEMKAVCLALGELGSRLLQAMFQQFLTRLLQMLGGLVLAALSDGKE